MKNTRLIKVIPQILLLSVFALSSCGNQAVSDKCLEGIKISLGEYKAELSQISQANNTSSWKPPQRMNDSKLQKPESIEGCDFTAQDNPSEQKNQPDVAKLGSAKKKYQEIYSELEAYISLASDYQSKGEQAAKLRAKLPKLESKDLSEGKAITDHTVFVKYARQEVDNLLQITSPTTAATSIKELNEKLIEVEKSNTEQTKQIEIIRKDLDGLKTAAAMNSLFNLLFFISVVGSLGYFIFRKGNSSKPDSRNDKGRKSGSGSLGSVSPQSPANQGYGNTHQGGKGLSGGRVIGRADNRSTRTSPRDSDEYPDENQNRYREGESDLDVQRQRDPNFRLNKPAQSQSNERGWGDRESNPNPVSSGDSSRQTYSSLAKVNRGLTEISATQFYQTKSYAALEPFTVGYYSATSESVTRNRADWANPLDLIEFYDGLFWIVKAIERSLLFPNPRIRIEQTRIRGIEYFFETNYTDENYHSCTVDAPAYVELVSDKWIRIKKGRINFL
jgi:hypothetical protein